VRVLEVISGTAGAYVLTGTVSIDERGKYIARVATHRPKGKARRSALHSTPTDDVSGPSLEASGLSPPEARREICIAARAQLGVPVTSFVWRPILALVPTRPVRMRVPAR
jgi:hypothetical protein